ncbi:MAG: hypothetical protein ACD_83C00297G0004 [uncultured bacterium]|nr:MAG: hypothetical protein ACD_83C00297G0004 [uncultured bacterium]
MKKVPYAFERQHRFVLEKREASVVLYDLYFRLEAKVECLAGDVESEYYQIVEQISRGDIPEVDWRPSVCEG